MRRKNVRLWSTSTLAWCSFAGDLVLFLQSQKGLIQKAMNLPDEIFKRFRLSINKSKTETMIINMTNKEQPTSIIFHHDTKLNSVNCFKYLGAHLQQHDPSTGDTELNCHMQMADTNFQSSRTFYRISE